MTFEKYFVAIRHESEMTTPLIQSPMINFSLREMGYLGIFGLSVIFAAVGTVPVLFAIATLPLFVLAFFKWHGEIPEMYLYYIAMSIFEPSAKNKKKTRIKTTPSNVTGLGNALEVKVKPVQEIVLQKITFSDDSTPIDLTLDIGDSHKYETVVILINNSKIARDETNGTGHITVTIIPQQGKKKFTVKNQAGNIIITKMVEFEHD